MIHAGVLPGGGRVVAWAAELFAVLATPMRLRVLSARREKSVNEPPKLNVPRPVGMAGNPGPA